MRYDPRLMRVGIEVSGGIRWYEDIYMTASGTKYANDLSNECCVKMVNLNKEVRDFILTEVTPYNFIRSPKRLIVEAGRASTGLFRIFSGDITRAAPTQPPDIGLTINAVSNSFAHGTIVSRSMLQPVKLSELSASVATDLGLELQFEATEKTVANYSFAGSVVRQVGKLGEVGAVNAFVDDARLIVKDTTKPLANVSHVLSARSGMVGIPEQIEHGCRVKYMLEPNTRLGGQLVIDSKLNPGMSGKFIVYRVDFEIANRDVPFYNVVECLREGFIW